MWFSTFSNFRPVQSTDWPLANLRPKCGLQGRSSREKKLPIPSGDRPGIRRMLCHFQTRKMSSFKSSKNASLLFRRLLNATARKPLGTARKITTSKLKIGGESTTASRSNYLYTARLVRFCIQTPKIVDKKGLERH